MRRATLKSLWARKVRLLLSTLSIVLGVAFVCGSLLFTNMLSDSLDSIVKGATADVNVAAETLDSGALNAPGAAIAPLDEADVAQVEAIDGVSQVVGLISSSQVYPLDKQRHLLGFYGAPGIGANWHDAAAAGAQQGASLVAGRAPQSDSEVVMDPTTASRGGFAIGDEVAVSTPKDGIKEFTLVGTGAFGGGGTAGASYLFFTTDEIRSIAQQDQPGFYALWVCTDAGQDPGAIATAIDQVLPASYTAKTGDQIAVQVSEQLDAGLGFVSVFLLAFAGIALLVSTLLILNTFSILVAQRAHELALLRAIGAKRSQVRNSVLLEALAIGAIGASVGLLVGYGLAWGIVAAMRLVGIELGSVAPTLTFGVIVASYGIGIGATTLAAYLPARRASQARPVEAMTTSSQPGNDSSGRLGVAGIVLIEVGVAALVCGILFPVSQPLVWLGSGAALLLIGMVLAATTIGSPLLWLFGWLLGRLFGEVGKLARLNAARQPRRTAATAATLMIGLALVSAVAILAASTTTSMGNRLAADQRGDFLIAPVAYQSFDAAVAQRASAVAGVENAYSFSSSPGQLLGQSDQVSITGATREGLERGTSLKILAGTLSADGDAQPALVSADFARSHGLALGQMVDLVGATGQVPVLITGVHDGGAVFPVGDIVVTPEVFRQVGDDSMVRAVVVFDSAGADQALVRDGLRAATAELPTVVVSDVAEYTASRISQFSQLFSVLYALLALALVISVLGIVNTLGLSVLERTREIGLLRAVGLTRAQVRRMITLEAVVVTILGSLLGVALGLVFGAGLVRLLGDQGIDTLVIPGWQLLVFVVVAVLVGVLASWPPARRAGRLDVLKSIATQ